MKLARITAGFFLILIISGCISSSTFPSPSSPSHPSTQPHEQVKYTVIQIYFAPFSDETVNHIIALINSSNKSIHAAVYDLDLESIAEVLEQANARGVDDKIVRDDRQAKREK